MKHLLDANGIGQVKSEICSDIIKIYVEVNRKNIIEDAKFQAKGCPPVIAAYCILTEMIKKMDVYAIKNITSSEIIKELNGLPKEKEHCAELVINTLHKAIKNMN